MRLPKHCILRLSGLQIAFVFCVTHAPTCRYPYVFWSMALQNARPPCALFWTVLPVLVSFHVADLRIWLACTHGSICPTCPCSRRRGANLRRIGTGRKAIHMGSVNSSVAHADQVNRPLRSNCSLPSNRKIAGSWIRTGGFIGFFAGISTRHIVSRWTLAQCRWSRPCTQ